MSYSKEDIGFLESIDTVLDFAIEKIKNFASSYFHVSEEDKDLLEFNRFERANIIYINYLQKKDQFKKLTIEKQSENFIELVFDSLANPELLIGTSFDELEYLKENPVDDDDEKFLLNNKIFDWFNLSKFDNEYKSVLIHKVTNILKSNSNNSSIILNNIDLDLYRAISSNPNLLRKLNWRMFEKMLADILERFEFEVELQKGTKDGGIDIIAIKRYSPFGIHRYLLQAKMWNDKVGVEPVRSLIWAHNEYRVTKSCLATTSTFTKGAWDLANKYRWQIELKDYDKIIEWIDLAREKNK